MLHGEGWGAGLGFPGIVLDAESPTVTVHVLESPALTASEWERLDAFEGPGYRRTAVVVVTADGELAASIYALA